MEYSRGKGVGLRVKDSGNDGGTGCFLGGVRHSCCGEEDSACRKGNL